jgi:RNA polymerase sigma-70 factor (ECF subfamily)
MTIAHRRAVDRVRSENACSLREQKAALDMTATDEDVADTVAARLDRQRVHRCLEGLTELQRESIRLAYFGGYSYPQVAQLLGAALGTVKARIRDGLIRMRDCLGVTW